MMKNHQDIVKCLREKPLPDLMSVDVKESTVVTYAKNSCWVGLVGFQHKIFLTLPNSIKP